MRLERCVEIDHGRPCWPRSLNFLLHIMRSHCDVLSSQMIWLSWHFGYISLTLVWRVDVRGETGAGLGEMCKDLGQESGIW